MTLSVAMALSVPGLAQAEPEPAPNGLAALIAEVAEANQQLQEVGARVQAQQESVNKAIVEVQDARDAAAAGQQQVDASEQAVKDANAAIAAAQNRFDTFAVATYMNGPSASLLVARTPEDVMSTAAAGQMLALSSQQVMVGLQQARTEVVNKDAGARVAKQKADQAVQQAQASQDAAVAALTEAQKNFREQQAEIDRLAAERKAAQQKLDAARVWSAPVPAAAGAPGPTRPAAAPADPSSGDRWDPAAAASGRAAANGKVPYGDPSEWDLTLPTIPSAFLSGDPVQIINAVLQIAMNSMQVTQQLGKQFLTRMGILKPTDTGINNGTIPMVYGNQAIEYVIKRAQSQIGVPYSWGGGNANGPSRGIDDGANTVGFDCSGLVLYAFAGAGIKLPHYSGSQYTAGRQVPSSQMRRGDVIFYGPNGSQHEALYLGGGQMLEAPYTGSDVHISPVRTSGMTPYVARFIEY
ncbi:Peptidoglycan endopeptidase RipA [uncultured Mycobacterium sp.]|uniref:Peptidase M23 n=3 Tax=Mycobacteriaceae TaxID=1762 RepID=A0A064CEH8_9MYCO|nr:peptidase M23 [Mycolicibacterium aromaticivorans JS19b1 = JCM 16368]SBS77550.1 Peptidoglycan endopeptidase RipA [uncultured Mycobacterium sp.]